MHHSRLQCETSITYYFTVIFNMITLLLLKDTYSSFLCCSWCVMESHLLILTFNFDFGVQWLRNEGNVTSLYPFLFIYLFYANVYYCILKVFAQ